MCITIIIIIMVGQLREHSQHPWLKLMCFARVWVTFSKYFGWKGTVPSNPHWSGKTRDIPVLYGVKILTDNYSVLSQYTHLTDRRTDGQQYRALYYMQSHGKNVG